MFNDNISIFLLLILGILGKSNVLAAAAAILFLIKIFKLFWILPLLENRGLETGLLFLLLSVLVPFAHNKFPLRLLIDSILTLPGILVLIGGVLATHLNGKGINLLATEPGLIIPLVVGSLIGIIFFGGIPVGPLMAGGIAAFLLYILQLFK